MSRVSFLYLLETISSLYFVFLSIYRCVQRNGVFRQAMLAAQRHGGQTTQNQDEKPSGSDHEDDKPLDVVGGGDRDSPISGHHHHHQPHQPGKCSDPRVQTSQRRVLFEFFFSTCGFPLSWQVRGSRDWPTVVCSSRTLWGDDWLVIRPSTTRRFCNITTNKPTNRKSIANRRAVAPNRVGTGWTRRPKKNRPVPQVRFKHFMIYLHVIRSTWFLQIH